MNSTGSQTAPPPAAKAPSFKSRYKLHGIIASVVVMWLDYALIHHGLVANDLGIVSAGMIIMLAAAAVAYYFG
jgi:hypothetical protein